MKLKDLLGIKSPSAEAAKFAHQVIEDFMIGWEFGHVHFNCRSVIVYQEPAPQPKYWDVKASRVFEDISPERHQMRKWLSQVPHGGIVGDSAVLIVYNKQAPEQSEMIVEGINT
jgi:hypothetical protein